MKDSDCKTTMPPGGVVLGEMPISRDHNRVPDMSKSMKGFGQGDLSKGFQTVQDANAIEDYGYMPFL